jgi:adenylate cyclase
VDGGLGVTCGSCGTELGGSAKFCGECGTLVAKVPHSAEYKQVTVLFADVVHSMDIAAAVGPERLREIMAELADCCAGVVTRFGGTVDKFTGDGVMAVFGAPVALEDHAVRACLAALTIQTEVRPLADDVQRRDGLVLRLRIGLNSGQVIAGEIGSGPFGYTAIGDQVGMAQRMESAAPPGGVMLSGSTARLVQTAAALSDVATVHIKGTDVPVRAFRLLGMASEHGLNPERSTLVGRELELHTMTGLLHRAMAGRGSVVCLVGPPGIGKSRLVGELIELARSRRVEVMTTYCESHATQIPFHAAARLFRAAVGITGLDDPAARAEIRRRLPNDDPDDLLLLDDLLGVADPNVMLPPIDPDARRRRLGALINTANLARTEPIVYVMEDAHWIDEVSESMMADVLAVISQTPALAMITYRPEYAGRLAHVPGAQTISLAALAFSEISSLVDEQIGCDESVAAIKDLVAARAAGNPFFAQEIVRELAERGVLQGDRGAYRCRTDVTDVSVPATLQAAIAARIDRLDAGAKETINAAAVIGTRFTAELLEVLGVEPVLDGLRNAELVDQVRFTPYAEYAFRHPLIQAVAYESQLKSARAQLHKRLASAIEAADQSTSDENAALIAQHLEAAGDLRDAYGWYMRAGAWSVNRNVAAARLSWERAQSAADSLPADEPGQLALRIAPRTMLYATAWRGTPQYVSNRFEEFRALCVAADDRSSLAIGMTGLVAELMQGGRVGEALTLAHEQMALVESVGDPLLTVTATFPTIAILAHGGSTAAVLRWAQTVIDWAAGDAGKDTFAIGSPLAVALAMRGGVRWWLGQPGWREDLNDALALARKAPPSTLGFVIPWTYGLGIFNGVLLPDDAAIEDLERALLIAEVSGDDNFVGSVKYTSSTVLMYRDGDAGSQRALALLYEVREMIKDNRFPASELPLAELYIARNGIWTGDYRSGVTEMQRCLDAIFDNRQSMYGTGATALLVDVLVSRGSDADLLLADAAVDNLEAAGAEGPSFACDIMVLRLRTVIAEARGDAAYAGLRDRYRTVAGFSGFAGHIAWSEALP